MKSIFFLSEAQKAIKLKNTSKNKKIQNENDPINLRYSNGEIEGK